MLMRRKSGNGKKRAENWKVFFDCLKREEFKSVRQLRRRGPGRKSNVQYLEKLGVLVDWVDFEACKCFG